MVAEAVAKPDGGGEEISTPWVEMWVAGSPISAVPRASGRMNADQSRSLGRALPQAAAKLDALTGQEVER